MVFAWHKCLRLLSWEFTSKCHLLIPKLEVSDLENLDLTHSSAGESPLSSRSSKKAVGTRKEKNYRKQSLESGVRNWFGLFSTTQRSNMRHSQKDQLAGCTPISRKKFKGKHEKQPLSLKKSAVKKFETFIHICIFYFTASHFLLFIYLTGLLFRTPLRHHNVRTSANFDRSAWFWNSNMPFALPCSCACRSF